MPIISFGANTGTETFAPLINESSMTLCSSPSQTSMIGALIHLRSALSSDRCTAAFLSEFGLSTYLQIYAIAGEYAGVSRCSKFTAKSSSVVN